MTLGAGWWRSAGIARHEHNPTRNPTMHTNNISGSRLATGQNPTIDRRAIGRGYRSAALLSRLSTEPQRHDAAERLCRAAKAKPSWLHQHRSNGKSLPCERLDAALIDGIANRWITRETLADYFADLFALYEPMIPAECDDVSFVNASREKIEAVDAMAEARCNPTPETREHARRELAEDVIVSLAYGKTLQNA